MTPSTTDAVVTHRSPSRESRVLYWTSRATLRHLYRSWPLTPRGISGLRTIERRFDRLPHPKGVTITRGHLGSVRTEVVTPDRGTTPALKDATVLYLHGGAFMFCGPATHRRVTASLATGLGVPVHVVDYRMLPEVVLGTSIDDAYAAYRAVSEQLPEHHRIVLAGDSAGAFLAGKICEFAGLDGIRRPAALIGYSPLLDLDARAVDGPWRHRDAYQPASCHHRARELWSQDADSVRGARSMLDIPPSVFPPLFMTVSAGELIEATALALTERFHAAGRTIETHRWHSGVHAFPVLATLTPESRRAGELSVDFLRRVLQR